MIRSILLEDVVILSVCAPNNRASNYRKQKLMTPKGETDKSIIVAGDLNV